MNKKDTRRLECLPSRIFFTSKCFCLMFTRTTISYLQSQYIPNYNILLQDTSLSWCGRAQNQWV